MRVRILVALLLMGIVLDAPPAGARVPERPPPASGGRPRASCADLFGPAEAAQLEARWGAHDLTVSVHDPRTGCWYDFGSNRRLGTASVFKVAMMGKVLLAAQDAGRGLTAYEDSLIWPMITQSDNTTTSTLFSAFGGVAGMTDFYARTGMWSTVTSSSTWGSTQTSARDQVELLRMLLGDRPGLFNDYSRTLAHHYLSNVIAEQRWGVGAGRAPGWNVDLKNGFAPASCCGWRINSIGRITSPAGDGYEMAVLTDRWGYEAEGIRAVEEVSSIVNARLAEVDPGALPAVGPVVVNADGRMEAFGVSAVGVLFNCFQLAIGQGWSGWYPHPGSWPTEQQVSAIRNDDGRVEVFVLLTDGRLMHSAQLPLGQGWTSQDVFGQFLLHGPAAARNRDGRLEVFAVGWDRQLWHRYQDAAGGWSGWYALGGSFGGPPAVGITNDGRLIVSAVSDQGVLQATVQTVANGSWSAMVAVGGGAKGRPAVGSNADGRMEIVALATDGRLVHSWQVGFGWSALFALSETTFAVSPALAANADGRLEVFAVDQTGRLIHQWQNHPNSGWSGTYVIGTGVSLAPAVTSNPDGRLEVFSVTEGGQLWHAFQRAPNSAFSPLYSLGGSLAV